MKRGPNWRGGRIRRPRGYIMIWEPNHPLAGRDGYVLEHRKVVFDAGIEIPLDHHVHHINGDRADNRLENLSVHACPDHHRMHVGDTVQNQYGEWPVYEGHPTPSQRAALWNRSHPERRKEITRRYRQRHRDRGEIR